MDRIKCEHCGSADTRLILEKTLIDTEDGYLDESVETIIFCNDCLKSTPFPEELDWINYD